jgi:aspartate aminotransferase-like enzyme
VSGRFGQQLRIPGPAPLPDRVLRAMARAMVDHRGPEFAELFAELSQGARRVFRTQREVLVLTCSGTGALESAVANLLSPGEAVLSASCGMFGERFGDLAAVYGADVRRLEAEWGRAVEPEQLREALASNPEAGVVLLAHNETSTGVANPLPELAAVCREMDRLLVVDGVSSISSMPFEGDAWGVDVAVSSSQKGWMAPPGVAFVMVGSRGWEKRAASASPRYYLDWGRAAEFAARAFTPSTPAVATLYGVLEGIRMLEEEGLERAWERHRRLAEATAAGLEAMGLPLFAPPGRRSATVTGALTPEGLDLEAFRRRLREAYGVVVGGGLGKMQGRMVRVGHLGAVSEGDVVETLWAMERALADLSVAVPEGAALKAAAEALGREPAPAPAGG